MPTIYAVSVTANLVVCTVFSHDFSIQVCLVYQR